MTDIRTTRQSTIREGRRGERLTARRFNAPIRALNRALSGVGQAQIAPAGRVTAGVLQAKRLTVVSVGADYIACRAPADQSGNTQATVYVALPYMLRRTPFDGASRNGISYSYSSNTARTADDGSATEDQVIVPSYVAGDEILATRGLSGGTGVVVTIEGVDVTLDMIDLNVDARAWAKATA